MHLSLICDQIQIVILKSLQNWMVKWYHEVLGHPGESRTKLTIKQHFTWKKLCKTVQQVVSGVCFSNGRGGLLCLVVLVLKVVC